MCVHNPSAGREETSGFGEFVAWSFFSEKLCLKKMKWRPMEEGNWCLPLASAWIHVPAHMCVNTTQTYVQTLHACMRVYTYTHWDKVGGGGKQDERAPSIPHTYLTMS